MLSIHSSYISSWLGYKSHCSATQAQFYCWTWCYTPHNSSQIDTGTSDFSYFQRKTPQGSSHTWTWDYSDLAKRKCSHGLLEACLIYMYRICLYCWSYCIQLDTSYKLVYCTHCTRLDRLLYWGRTCTHSVHLQLSYISQSLNFSHLESFSILSNSLLTVCPHWIESLALASLDSSLDVSKITPEEQAQLFCWIVLSLAFGFVVQTFGFNNSTKLFLCVLLNGNLIYLYTIINH